MRFVMRGNFQRINIAPYQNAPTYFTDWDAIDVTRKIPRNCTKICELRIPTPRPQRKSKGLCGIKIPLAGVLNKPNIRNTGGIKRDDI
jgi:hypothetical protein